MSAPAPFVPQEVDCTDLDGFMLNVERLMASELVALSSHEVIGAALMLWCRAWKQRPAASLPNNEKVLAAFAMMPVVRFRKLRAEVLRGFVLCDDGRLYHRTLAAEALKAYERKVTFRKKRENDADRLRKWRNGAQNKADAKRVSKPFQSYREEESETLNETRFVAEGQGQGQGQGQGHLAKGGVGGSFLEKPSAAPSASPDAKSARGSRLPADWTLPGEWGEWALREQPAWTIDRVSNVADSFRDYWVGKAGADARKTDWQATWRNWVRRETSKNIGAAQSASRQSRIDNYAAQAAAARGEYESDRRTKPRIIEGETISNSRVMD